MSFKKACFAYIASQLLLSHETEELSRIFKLVDTSNDGKLSLDEVKAGYRTTHTGDEALSEEEIEAIFCKVDSANSGFIDYSEFVVAALDPNQLTSQ